MICAVPLLLACRTEPALPTRLRGAQEVLVRPDGGRLPWVLGHRQPVGLCVTAPPGTDSSRWRARLVLGGKRLAAEPGTGGLTGPSHRLGSTLCFTAPAPAAQADSTELELCGRLEDELAGRVRPLACQQLAFSVDTTNFDELAGRLPELLALQAREGLGPFLRALAAREAEASAAAFPLLAARLALVASHYLVVEGSPAALARADQELADLPSWLAEWPHPRAAQLWQQRAALEQAPGGEPSAAWKALARAEAVYRGLADSDFLTVAIAQAELLAQAGAPREGAVRLRAALADCERLSCLPLWVESARQQLAWTVLLDTDATTVELEEVAPQLAGVAPGGFTAEPLEAANQAINASYFALRLGRSIDEPLGRARQLLASGSGERHALLSGWTDLVAAAGAMARGDHTRALELCGVLADRGRSTSPQLAPWAWSCLGQARRGSGDRAGAERAFATALSLHDFASASRLGLAVPLGAAERAADFAQAARLAVERGDPHRAWQLLSRLDALSAHEGRRRDCQRLAAGEAVQRWRALTAESERLLAELAELERPASLARQAEAESLRRDLQQQLQGLWWQWPGCEPAGRGDDAGVDFRAFAVDDEILLLARRPDGQVELERRTPFSYRRLVDSAAALTALESAAHDLAATPAAGSDSWESLLLPLTQALLPRDLRRLKPLTVYALHGPLQALPMAALPLPGQAPGVLGDLTTVALQPLAAQEATTGINGRPLFVLDPLGDLPAALASRSFYRGLFPDAQVLAREQANLQAFRDALARASWLHLDSHGSFNPAFPELSALRLADGPLTFLELAELPAPRRFVNLSGCRTGAWSITPDSGHYGLGGLLARLGAGWVIASRSPLEDALAREYNLAFYRRIATGGTVPEAHRQGLDALRGRYPPRQWGGLLLLRGTGKN